MKCIDAEKLIAEIERLRDIAQGYLCGSEKQSELSPSQYRMKGIDTICSYLLSFITSLQQEQQETDMKSPFTGGKVAILSRQEEVTFRGEKVKILRKYYRCEDTGREFTNDKLDDDMMWAVFRAYCEKKGMTSFTDIMLKQEQPSLPSNLDEAAKKWKEEHFRREYYRIPKDAMSCSFKAGAEWMAGQGASFNTEVGRMIRDWPDDIFNKFEMDDEVVVQIRKK